ncbi:MAG: competence/damage-inducible protein A [Oscillospiraceae bacterium]|nr:competence/damage-inducible protein A [Oscillospiraceae bacterium]
MQITAKSEIINVGTELLLGDILNTNHQYLSKRLAELGIAVYYQSSVGDNPARLEALLKQALERSNLIIITGGLGPTVDDLTKQTAAQALGFKLVRNAECEQRIRSRFEAMGWEMSANNLLQADIPEGALILPNEHGTAPGCVMQKEGKSLILLPGPPKELKPMFEAAVVPFLLKSFETGIIHSVGLKIFGVGESKVDDLLAGFFRLQNPTVAPYAKDGEVLVRISARAASQNEAEALINPILMQIREILGDNIYGEDVAGLEEALVLALKAKGKSLAAAESCTGGLLAKRITDISGASEVFPLGVVSYSAEQKVKLLGVSRKIIDAYGVYSHQTARVMAERVRDLAGTDLGIGITGIAGPCGGTEELPAGTVFIAVASKTGTVSKLINRTGYEREQVRNYAVNYAIKLALTTLKEV